MPSMLIINIVFDSRGARNRTTVTKRSERYGSMHQLQLQMENKKYVAAWFFEKRKGMPSLRDKAIRFIQRKQRADRIRLPQWNHCDSPYHVFPFLYQIER